MNNYQLFQHLQCARLWFPRLTDGTLFLLRLFGRHLIRQYHAHPQLTPELLLPLLLQSCDRIVAMHLKFHGRYPMKPLISDASRLSPVA